jgi:hypothetical protein
MPSPNYSSRGGARVRLIVLHTAEGSTTIESLGSWFGNPANEVSSHTGIDDTPNTVGEFVRRDDGSAWTAAAANPYSVQTELCGFASWTADVWAQHPTMLSNCAAWIAEEAAHFGIPIVRLTAAQAQDGRSTGVCQHVDLGPAGGGHWDCGDGLPMDQLIAMASGSSAPAPKKRSRNLIAATASGNGYWTTTEDGAIYAFGDAQNKGSPYDRQGTDNIQPGQSVVGIEGHGNDGYWLLISDGSVFAYGSAPYKGRPDRT